MKKIKIFISSVQSEFAIERRVLYDFLLRDALLSKFFSPIIFEEIPASEQNAQEIFLDKVADCDLYLGILGKSYGNNALGLSPTELEFETATKLHKTRLLFISDHAIQEREPDQQNFVHKVEQQVTRKKFSSTDDLQAAVYAALVRYLEQKSYIHCEAFDASVCSAATFSDIDDEKLSDFVRAAKSKRGFPIAATASSLKILTHLDLIKNGMITNAAILLFGKQPQYFFRSSEIKCAQFFGTTIENPYLHIKFITVMYSNL
jgi:hypothetical protein